MKQPKKLTRSQKEVLLKNKMNWHEYMLLAEDKYTFTVISKKDNKYGRKEQYTFSK